MQQDCIRTLKESFRVEQEAMKAEEEEKEGGGEIMDGDVTEQRSSDHMEGCEARAVIEPSESGENEDDDFVDVDVMPM
jgi:hypothetical protein